MTAYQNIRLEKGMYNISGKSFTQVLEELDPSESYRGTDLEGLDAYQRQLKRFNIRVSGEDCSRVEDFFRTTESAALFPEFVARAVQQGMDRANKLSSMVAAVTKISSSDYRTVTITQHDESGTVAEGGELPVTVIKNQGKLVEMKKHGRLIQSSYEALRYHSLELFAVMLREIGAELAREQLSEAAQVLLKGDGNSNPAASDTLNHAPAYSDMLALWGEIAPYELSAIAAGTQTMQDVLSIDELRDAAAGLNFQGSGSLGTPMGAELIHVPGFDNNTILGFDRRCALEMVQAGNVMIDYDKLINRQLECASVSAVTGFAKLCPDAVHAVKYTK